MAARPSWQGGIEFAGFPISVKLFPLVKASRGDSFKMLDPDNNQPVKQQYVDSEGNVVKGEGVDSTVRGVPDPHDPSRYHVLSQAQLDSVALIESTKITPPRAFVPLDQLPMVYAERTYTVVPNDKVPGSDGPLGILWNGLRAGRLAYVTEITMRAGAPDRIMAVWADQTHLYATSLPYLSQVDNDVPDHKFTVDKKQATVFTQFVELSYEVSDFDHRAFKSKHKQVRDGAIQAALEGKVHEPEDARPAPNPVVPDLMAQLEASIEKATGKKPPASKPSRKAPAKKSAAKKSTRKKVAK